MYKGRLKLSEPEVKTSRDRHVKAIGLILAVGYAIAVTTFVWFFYLLEAITWRIALFYWAGLMIPFLYCMYQTYQNRVDV